jgi:outer membrane protein assembly factor BamB
MTIDKPIKMRTKIVAFIALIFFFNLVEAQQTYSWRENNRTGVSAETGLLKSWPAEGPALLWTNLELSKGYSSVSFGKDIIYITGTQDGNDILYALDNSGKMLWKEPMGRAWNESFPDSRATPTVEGDKVYTCSGLGDLACFDATGKVIWTYKGSETHKGTYGAWGIAESLIIDGDKLYFSPGGPETMTIALNKTDGKLLWKSASLNDKPAYVSPILVNHHGIKMLINSSQNFLYGVDVSKGEILWKVAYVKPADFTWDFIPCVTPLYEDGKAYLTIGYNCGAFQVKIADDGKSATEVWKDMVLDVHHGGAVLLNGYIYGSNWVNNNSGNWCCIDWATGKTMWEEKWNTKGAIIAAEGMLYLFDEKNGNVGLVKANPEKFELVSSFKVIPGKAGPFWAHPVIHNGILYLRHTNSLMAYDIKAK